jgi:hypothetical protein
LGLQLLVLLSVFGFLASVKDVFSLIVRLVLGVDACVISLFVLLCCDLNKSSLGCGAWSLVFFKSNWFLELKPLLSFCELVLEFLEFTFQPKGILLQAIFGLLLLINVLCPSWFGFGVLNGRWAL